MKILPVYKFSKKNNMKKTGLIERANHNNIVTIETNLEKNKKVKFGMMQNLLTGKIRLV